MDISFVEKADFHYNKDLQKNIISDMGIASLSDCSLILLHKCGMRPLWVVEGNLERVILRPEQMMKKPDLILFSPDDAGNQSARIIQEQLENCDCKIKIAPIDIATIQTKQPELLESIISTRIRSLEEKGYQHVIFVENFDTLNKLSMCINKTPIAGGQDVPVYSFSDGKQIQDSNLDKNLYVTRDILDNFLIRKIQKEDSPDLKPFKGKCRFYLEPHQLKNRLHLYE